MDDTDKESYPFLRIERIPLLPTEILVQSQMEIWGLIAPSYYNPTQTEVRIKKTFCIFNFMKWKTISSFNTCTYIIILHYFFYRMN